MRKLIERYSWIERLDVVMTVAVIQGRTEQEVVSVYGGDPSRSAMMTFSEAEDAGSEEFGEYFHCQVFSHGHDVVALENNGWSGSIPEIARRASEDGGRFFSVFWNVNGVFRIVQAVDGQVVAWFDPMYGGERVGPADLIPEWISGLSLQTGHLRAASLALIEQQTGLAFDRRLLNTRLPTYRIPDPDVMLNDVENARLP